MQKLKRLLPDATPICQAFFLKHPMLVGLQAHLMCATLQLVPLAFNIYTQKWVGKEKVYWFHDDLGVSGPLPLQSRTPGRPCASLLQAFV